MIVPATRPLGSKYAAPAGASLYGDTGTGEAGVIEDGVLKLTKAVNSQQGGFVIDDLDGGATVYGFTARFKLLIGGGTQADGFSFSFGPDVPDAGIGEEGAGSGMIVCFDTYDNGGGEAPAIDIKKGGVMVASFKQGAIGLMRKNAFQEVVINIDSDGSLDLTVGGTTVFANLPGAFDPTPGRFALGARTGGLNDNQWVDDLDITTKLDAPAQPVVKSIAPLGAGAFPDAVVTIQVQDMVTKLNPASVVLKFNGAVVTANVAQAGDLTTITYDPPGLLGANTTNSVELSFQDNGTPPQTGGTAWSFVTVNYLGIPPSFALPASAIDLSKPGFTVRTVKARDDAGLPNANIRTEEHLAGVLIDPLTGQPFENQADLSLAGADGLFITDVINFDQNPVDAGAIPGDLLIPAIPGIDGGTDNVSVEMLAYVELAANTLYTLIVNSDDGFKLTAGAPDPRDVFALNLGKFDGGRGQADTPCVFVAQAAGYYPMRLIYEEGGSDARVELSQVLADGTRLLVNDPADTRTARAYYARAAGQPALPPYVRAINPLAGQRGVTSRPTISAIIREDKTQVNTASVQLLLNDKAVTPSISRTNNDIYVTYKHSAGLPGETDAKVKLVYSDNAVPPSVVTKEWTFTTGKVVRNLADGMVVCLPFDGDYNDYSGRGNNGAAKGAPSFVAGKIGSKALFYNTDTGASPKVYNYVSLGNPADLQLGTDVNFSVAFWIKFTGLPGDLPFFANNDVSMGDMGVTIAPSYNEGGWSWGLNDSVAPKPWPGIGLYGPRDTLNDDQWHHLVHTFNRTGEGTTYLDGVKVHSQSVTSAAGWDLNTGKPYNIGQASGTYPETGEFTMDDFAVWRRVVEADEVAKIYNGGQQGKSIADLGVQPCLNVKINFQNSTSGGYPGYLPDNGLVFADRGNGFSYGWAVDNSGNARNRNQTDKLLAPDERYDTLNHLQNTGGPWLWEIALPSGDYLVHIVGGDPNNFDQTVKIKCEDVLVVDAVACTADQRFSEGARMVHVEDGRLTLQAAVAEGAINAKVSFMEISSVGAAVRGQWNFDNGLQAALGNSLEYLDGPAGETAANTTFGITGIGDLAGVPRINGELATVMHFAKCTAAMGYVLRHDIAPNPAGATKVNQWTLIMDINWPNPGLQRYSAIVQLDNLNPANNGDADQFVRWEQSGIGGIGISGNYPLLVPMKTNTWHRIAMAVDMTAQPPVITKFIDGVKAIDQTGASGAAVDGRFALNPLMLLFTDDDDETLDGYVSSIQVRDGKMLDEEIAALGGPTAGGIPIVCEVPEPEPPTLKWTVSGNNITISWDATATGFTLEVSPTVMPANWQVVPNVTGNSVTLPIGAGNQFFRARR